MSDIKIERTADFVDFITREQDAYDKDLMKYKIYFATDTQMNMLLSIINAKKY